MIRISKFQRPQGYWYVRYWLGGRPIDESARTKSESAAEAYRVRREIEIDTGIEPIRHADVSELMHEYVSSLAPTASERHRHEVRRVLTTFTRFSVASTATVFIYFKPTGYPLRPSISLFSGASHRRCLKARARLTGSTNRAQ